jgi:NAD(P)-dependent dehydrogenase (short-subunit alcohol dehydrogenase family)
VFITGRRQSELDKAIAAIGGSAAAMRGDTSNLADLDHTYATIKAQAGHIDVLAVNAGVYEFGTFGEITEDDLGKPAVFLAFDDSTYVTGIELFEDGGVAQI